MNNELPKTKIDEKTGIEYHLEGDYYIPNLTMPKQEKISLNKYGRMRLNYLKEYKKADYSIMLLDGTLNTHLKEIQEQATLRVEQIIKQLKDNSDLTEEITKDETAVWYRISAGEELLRYIVEKGSIAIDGISLTVARVNGKDFSVSIIPHTQGETTLSERKVSDVVNLECDIIGKYVERLCGAKKEEFKKSTMTREFLLENGF